MQGRKPQERQESRVIQRQLRPETSSLDPSHVPEHGLKLQLPSVYRDMPEAPNSLVWIGGDLSHRRQGGGGRGVAGELGPCPALVFLFR